MDLGSLTNNVGQDRREQIRRKRPEVQYFVPWLAGFNRHRRVAFQFRPESLTRLDARLIVGKVEPVIHAIEEPCSRVFGSVRRKGPGCGDAGGDQGPRNALGPLLPSAARIIVREHDDRTLTSLQHFHKQLIAMLRGGAPDRGQADGEQGGDIARALENVKGPVVWSARDDAAIWYGEPSPAALDAELLALAAGPPENAGHVADRIAFGPRGPPITIDANAEPTKCFRMHK